MYELWCSHIFLIFFAFFQELNLKKAAKWSDIWCP
jgi:hypothetical protein